MTGPQLSPIRKAWYRWKSLRLPWRKRFLVGLDLQGNTYWEFHDAITTGRMRRIVEYPSNVQYSDIKLTPQWHQWLRHTRLQPPSLTEQSRDLVRQEQLKVLARRADERWNSKESYLDAPREQKILPGAALEDLGRDTREAVLKGRGVENLALGTEGVEGGRKDAEETTRTTPDAPEKERKPRAKEQKEDPWKRARGGPSEEWQPQAWSGDIAARRR